MGILSQIFSLVVVCLWLKKLANMSVTCIPHFSTMFHYYLGKKPSIPILGAKNRVNSIGAAFFSRRGVPVEVPLPNDVSLSLIKV